MTPEDRIKLIDRLDRSFIALPRWAKVACKHGMGAPSHHPETGKEFESFREVIEAAMDETLVVLKEDFESNEDLAPEEVPPEPEFTILGSKNVVSKEWVMWKARIFTHHKEKEISPNAITPALYAAKDKLDLPNNFPNPDPENLVLFVNNKERPDAYVFSYQTEPAPKTK